MSIFGKILDKLGFGKTASAQSVPDTDQSVASKTTATTPSVSPENSNAQPKVQSPSKEVDVVAKLKTLAEENSEQLNWKTSIVDLMKLLGLDSSLANRKELATELGCPADKMEDSAQMNIWLHRKVLQKLAENGGNVPPELL